jgi:catechol 2,3-dioxygenase-like lactoylglutathione lyase family enzyme
MKIRHVGIVCEDLNLMENFYENFGFKKFSENTESGQYIDHLTNIVGTKIMWKKYNNKFGDLLELLKYEVSFNIDKSISSQPVYRRGVSHIAFTVPDIKNTSELVKRLGGCLVNEPILSQDGKVKVCYANDVEGNLIELVEEL